MTDLAVYEFMIADINYDQSHFQVLLFRAFFRSYCFNLMFYVFHLLYLDLYRISIRINLNPLCVRRLLCRGIFKRFFFCFNYAIYNRWQHIGFNFNVPVYIAFQELNPISPKFSNSDSELEETRMKNRYTNILPCKLRKRNTVYALSSPFVFVTRP
jgi:hypothetical protein